MQSFNILCFVWLLRDLLFIEGFYEKILKEAPFENKYKKIEKNY